MYTDIPCIFLPQNYNSKILKRHLEDGSCCFLVKAYANKQTLLLTFKYKCPLQLMGSLGLKKN